MTTKVVAYTSLRPGHVTRPISFRTSDRKRRERPHQPVTLSRARPPNDSSCSAIAVFISHPCRRCRTGPETFDCPRRDPAGGGRVDPPSSSCLLAKVAGQEGIEPPTP